MMGVHYLLSFVRSKRRLLAGERRTIKFRVISFLLFRASARIKTVRRMLFLERREKKKNEEDEKHVLRAFLNGSPKKRKNSGTYIRSRSNYKSVPRAAFSSSRVIRATVLLYTYI